jgi:hypothetical protein
MATRQRERLTRTNLARMPRKRRTRQHVIADLSANHFERFVLLRRHSAEIFQRDYGLDMVIFFYDDDGMVLDGQVSVQLKASDHPKYIDDGKFVSLVIDERDLRSWTQRLEPVILVVFDAQLHRAFWLYVQTNVELQSTHLATRRSRNVRIPTAQVVNEEAIDKLAAYNEQVVHQIRSALRYGSGRP